MNVASDALSYIIALHYRMNDFSQGIIGHAFNMDWDAAANRLAAQERNRERGQEYLQEMVP